MANSTNRKLAAAIQYAELGYSVFPCVPNAKNPITPNGFKDASNDADVVTEWWTKTPNANIGVCTEGLLVVDVDGDENPWPNDETKAIELTAAPMAITPRGGRHFIFKQPQERDFRNTEGKLAPKVDTRANGGYIVVAPSSVNGTPYKWVEGCELDIPPQLLPDVPSWLCEDLDRLQTNRSNATGSKSVGSISAGERNATLASIAGSMRRQGRSETEIVAALKVTNRERCEPPLDDPEVERIAKSIGQYEPDKATVDRIEGSSNNTNPTINPARLWKPFPTELLPAGLAQFVRETGTAIGCDESMVALPMLATVASAIGMTREIELKKGWREPPVLWSGVVARSGSKKSPAHYAATKPLQDIQNDAFREHDHAMEDYSIQMAEYEKKPKKRRDPSEEPPMPIVARFVVNDCTIEALAPILEQNRRGVLCARDELNGWIGSFSQYKPTKGSDVPNWLQMANAGTVTVDRKTGPYRVIHIQRAAVSVCGTIQPGVLESSLTDNYFESGLAARILFAYPPEQKSQWTDTEVADDTLEWYANRVKSLVALQPAVTSNGDLYPMALKLTADAKRLFVPWSDQHNEKIIDTENDRIAAMLAKLEGYAARFALIFELVKNPDAVEVSSDSMQRAIALADWFVNEASRIYGRLGASDESRELHRLVDVVSQMGGRVTARDLYKRSRRFRPAAKAKGAILRLVEAKLGNLEVQASGPKGGRPTKCFVLATPELETDDDEFED